ncbi:hypothetical protein [Treponema sp.]|uniref:hypothetical protein n=1 Tax=Treponema sp. TaxID=166 RepID=UPI0025E88CD7|nr:hypothetical protein [Treponema sp.]MBR4322457.1 hypothetical protein [Treponema sp.]
MKRASAFVLIFSFLFLLLASGCNQSVDDMLDGYNGGFNTTAAYVGTKEIPKTYKPDEVGFEASMLLYDEYFLYDDAMLILAAPDECQEVFWRFYDPDDEYKPVTVLVRSGTDSNGNITYFKGTAYTGEVLTLYVPESGLTGPKTYQLQLMITSKGGNIYTDNCGIVIYQRYDR